eukprot:6547145-Ditylum_brightwellii.AAC.1
MRKQSRIQPGLGQQLGARKCSRAVAGFRLDGAKELVKHMTVISIGAVCGNSSALLWEVVYGSV